MSEERVIGKLVQNGQEYFLPNGFPSDTYIDIPWGANGMTYTAPADGWLVAGRSTTTTGQYLDIDVVGRLGIIAQNGTETHSLRSFVPLSAGQTLAIYYTAQTIGQRLRFIPARRAPGL